MTVRIQAAVAWEGGREAVDRGVRPRRPARRRDPRQGGTIKPVLTF